jgi:hypothetical protein
MGFFIDVRTWREEWKALESFLFQFCVHFIGKGCQWCYIVRKRSLFWNMLLQYVRVHLG